MKKKQKEYITEMGRKAMEENRSIKKAKKELIKKILKEAGYEPTVRYTRKEKRKFTRIVKNKLFAKPKPKMKVLYSKDDIYEQLPVKPGKQRPISAYEMVTTKEEVNQRKFRYVINRKCSDAPDRCYDFLTDYFDAGTRKEAKTKAIGIAKKYKDDTSFCGITVQDINGDNSITYYTRNRIFAA